MDIPNKVFELDPEELKNELRHWFSFDHLQPEEGVALLVGVVPSALNVAALVKHRRQPRAEDFGNLGYGIWLLDGDVISSNPRSNLPSKTNAGFVIRCSEGVLNDEAESRFLPLVQQHKKLMMYWNSGKHPETTSPSYFVDWAKSKDMSPEWLPVAEEIGLIKVSEGNISATDGDHVSDDLQYLKQAAFIFWANVDRYSPGRHPDNDAVAKWLVEKGYSPTTAGVAASIIRPAWAAKGRKPRNE